MFVYQARCAAQWMWRQQGAPKRVFHMLLRRGGQSLGVRNGLPLTRDVRERVPNFFVCCDVSHRETFDTPPISYFSCCCVRDTLDAAGNAMPTLDINGTAVAFPFEPYDCQLTYMRGVLAALDGSVCESILVSVS